MLVWVHVAWWIPLPGSPGTCQGVSGKGCIWECPSMDRAMHPWHEMVPAASVLRAGVRNTVSAGDRHLPQ